MDLSALLIPSYLVEKGLLARPSLYLSDFFERNRSSYYDALTRVRVSNDLIHWVRFFLTGVAATAVKGRDVFREILHLRQEVDTALLGLGKRARKALNLLYRNLFAMPVIIGELSAISKAIAGNSYTRWRRIDGCLQGAPAGASPRDVTASATQKAGDKPAGMRRVDRNRLRNNSETSGAT